MAGITLLQKLQKLYGARAVTDRLGKMTNVQTTAQGANNPFSGIFSKKYLGKNQDSIDEAHNVIMDNMQFAFGNKNPQQMKNFENNVNMLYDMKFPPAKAEAEILDLSTKKQVTGKGIDSLKKELGLPEGIDPNSPMGKIISDQNRVSKLGKDIGSKKKSIGEIFVEASKSAARPVNREKEGLVRTAAREFLNREIKLKKLNLNEKELKSIVSPSGSGEDPINVLRKYYGENTLVEFDNLGDKFLNTEKYSDFNKIIDKNVDSSFLKPRKDPNIKESYTDKEMAEIINKMETKEKDLGTKLKDLPDDIDPDAMAQGGIAGQLHLNRPGYENGLKVLPKVEITQSVSTPASGIDVGVRDTSYGGSGIYQGDKAYVGADYMTGNVKVKVKKEGETVFKDTMSKDDMKKLYIGLGQKEGNRVEVGTDTQGNYTFNIVKSFNQGGRASLSNGGLANILGV